MNNYPGVKTIPFDVEHVKLIDIREHELLGVFSEDNFEAKLAALQQVGTGVTLIYEGCILGVMGFFDLCPGVCEVWVLPSEHIPKHGLIFAKLIKSNLKQLWETKGYHRIQVHALDDKIHNRWLTWLGFKCEGVLEKYSVKKQNFKIWAMV